MVTTVLLPAVRRMKDPKDRVAFFEEVEQKFAWQARGTTLLVGISGIYLVYAWELWDRFTQIEYWWMHGMVLVWVIFSIMLFIAEPLFLHRWFLARSESKPAETFQLIQIMHWVLLTISLIVVMGATMGSHSG